jgi:hypothetical protein
MLTSNPPGVPGPPASGTPEDLRNLKQAVGENVPIAGKTRAARRRALDPSEMLKDLRIPAELRLRLAKPLQQLGYSLEEVEVSPIWKRVQTHRVCIIRSSTNHYLLHIPKAILEDNSDLNMFAVNSLGPMFPEGAKLLIFSRDLDNYPFRGYEKLVRSWSKISTKFVPWSWLEEVAQGEIHLDDLADLLDLSPSQQPIPLPAFPPERPPADDLDFVINILAKLADGSPVGAKKYIADLVVQLDLPDGWSPGDTWTGDPTVDARVLVRHLADKGPYPPKAARHGSKVLGVLIQKLYPQRGDPVMRKRFLEMASNYELLPSNDIDNLRNS